MIAFENSDIYTNYHGHGGYSPRELYIVPKYSTFKKELAYYKYMTMRCDIKIIPTKLIEYMQTDKAKSMEANLNSGILKFNLEYRNLNKIN